jgi:hypothetical protein
MTTTYATPILNETSFAKELMAATAYLVDAVAVTDTSRIELLRSAQNALGSALMHAYTEEERELVSGFFDTIRTLRKRGLDR